MSLGDLTVRKQSFGLISLCSSGFIGAESGGILGSALCFPHMHYTELFVLKGLAFSSIANVHLTCPLSCCQADTALRRATPPRSSKPSWRRRPSTRTCSGSICREERSKGQP